MSRAVPCLPMRVVLHGVRGSSPASGVDFLRVGGNTSCVAVTPDGYDAPTLLLDAGTGLSSVTRALAGAAFSGDMLLTHLHWDHVQGLPFFRAGDRDDARVRLLLPAQCGASAERSGSAAELLSRAMSPPHFPIGPDGLRGDWSFDAIDAGTFSAGGCTVTAVEVPHKGGRTFGYRIEADGMSLVYLPDHHLAIDPRPAWSWRVASTCCAMARCSPTLSAPSPTPTATPPSVKPITWRDRPE